jgi:indole-3-glycerol phosphate synthase
MILDQIAESTRARVARQKARLSLTELREIAEANDLPAAPSFLAALRAPELSLICEVKRASPSKGVIAADFPYLQIAQDYEAAGAAAISVLTEPEHFLGADRYLREIARTVRVPCLRKDFTLDPYQIYEAKVLGASAVLLICALLDPAQLREYLALARALGLDALTETHTADEIDAALCAGADIIGVNNRNLHTFEVSLQTCLTLCQFLPGNAVWVAESGIRTPDDTRQLIEAGFDAALIGETLMRSEDKTHAIENLRHPPRG